MGGNPHEFMGKIPGGSQEAVPPGHHDILGVVKGAGPRHYLEGGPSVPERQGR